MEQTECSETLAFKLQTPGNHPEESIQYTGLVIFFIAQPEDELNRVETISSIDKLIVLSNKNCYIETDSHFTC
jgi:hypothetical protein